MTDVKPHFELHFSPETYVLYEEHNGQYYREQWKTICSCPAIKRIHYNTKTYKHYLIIDIDNDNLYKYKESNLPEPNFILKNKEKTGGHLFYVLDKGIHSSNEFYLNKWKTLQREYTRLSGGDELNKGYVGKFINSNSFEYIELNPLAYDIDTLYSKIIHRVSNNQTYVSLSNSKRYSKTSLKTSKSKVFKNLDLIPVGERNVTLFNKTRKFSYIEVLKQSADDFKQSVSDYINRINRNLLEELPQSEINATTNSIIKYCLENKESIKNYLQTTNDEVLSTEEIRERQRESQRQTTKKRREKTLKKLKQAIKTMKSKEMKINVNSVSKYTKLSVNTVSKYSEIVLLKDTSKTSEAKTHSNDVYSESTRVQKPISSVSPIIYINSSAKKFPFPLLSFQSVTMNKVHPIEFINTE